MAPADKVPIDDGTVDLVTVAQALHWFDVSSFYPEVRRVAKPGGILAVWCYQLHSITPGDRRDRDAGSIPASSGRTGPPSARSSRTGTRRCRSRSTSSKRPNSGWFIPGTSSSCWATSARGRQLSVIESKTGRTRSR